MANPKEAFAAMGVQLPEGTQVKVMEQEPNTLFLFLPLRPAALDAQDELTEAELAYVAGGLELGSLVVSVMSG